MMSKLDKVIDVYIKEKSSCYENKTEIESIKELEDALREKLRRQIVEEVKTEHVQEMSDAADEEIERRANIEKLSQLKSLMWTGFVVAFVVGLFVNQITDIVGVFKGTVNLQSVWPTIIISIVLFLICLGLYLYSFFKNVIEMYNDIKKKKKDNQSS